MNSSKILVKNLQKSYGKRMVIKDLSLEILQGKISGLLGPNGAGKTTCFYIIAGLIKAQSGSIFLDNIAIEKMSIYQRAKLGICYLPQESSIFGGMNVEDNIASILEISQTNKNVIKEKLNNLLDEFGISHIRKSSAISLSGGERRRVEIARALANEPSFILLDEPFAGVDPIAVNDIRKMISYLKNRNIGVLITDHNVRETLSIVDEAYIVYDGKVLISGSKEKILANQEVRKIYLGEDFSI